MTVTMTKMNVGSLTFYDDENEIIFVNYNDDEN